MNKRIILKGDMNDGDYSYTFIENPSDDQIKIAKIIKKHLDLNGGKFYVRGGEMSLRDGDQIPYKKFMQDIKRLECAKDYNDENLEGEFLFNYDFCVFCEFHSNSFDGIELIEYKNILEEV